MSAGVPSLANEFGKLVRGKGSFWYQLLQNSEATLGFFDMASLNSLVTDSASAASAWGSGSRIFNGQINVLPDGTRLTPIAQLVKQAGKKVGLVTTTRITHATPAGFAAVQPQRDDEDDIAPQYLNVVDVLMGGGLRHYAPNRRKDGKDLIKTYQDAGYTYWNTREQILESTRPEKVLGLFSDSHLPYTVDHLHSDALRRTVPTLAEMTRKALEILSNAPNGFLLQIEGGRVDHAAHANDAAGIMWDQLAFDDAVEIAYEFVAKRTDTLLIVTSDHGNSNPGLNGIGSEYEESNRAFALLQHAKCSFEELPKKTSECQQRRRCARPPESAAWHRNQQRGSQRARRRTQRQHTPCLESPASHAAGTAGTSPKQLQRLRLDRYLTHSGLHMDYRPWRRTRRVSRFAAQYGRLLQNAQTLRAFA
jgi:alkaline phosphatase